MRVLKDLAKQLSANDFVMTESMKEQFEEILSVVAEGSRVLHPRFGLGTVKDTNGNAWVRVEFDKDNANFEERVKEYNEWSDVWHSIDDTNYEKRRAIGFKQYPVRRTRSVMISSCISVRMIIKKETNRQQ